MRRRALLLTSGLAVLASAMRDPLSAFAQDRPSDDALLAGVSEAYRSAQRARRPLLVLVIPDDNGARWERGIAFGAWINHGSDDALTALGLVELTCAPMSALRQLVPQAPSGEPLMVLVDPSGVPASARALDAALPALELMRRGDGEAEGEVEEIIDTRNATLTSLLTGALRAELSRLASTERATARQRAVDTHRAHRIRGSHWATDSGCGVYVEEAPDTGGYDCGMGYVPPRARRFLHFFAVARP
ncbi:MAG: hypothetical protein J0L92_19860 [Deltaproteobacteria bacterium]|nr:hypothetical protein [Deltaproteobacteria bacterium]